MQRPDLLTAVSTIPPDLDRAAALDLTEQEPEGSYDADEEAGQLEDLKVVVSIKGGRATIGVQRPSSDPHIESFDGHNLSELTQEAQAAVERARASGDVAQPRLGDRTSKRMVRSSLRSGSLRVDFFIAAQDDVASGVVVCGLSQVRVKVVRGRQRRRTVPWASREPPPSPWQCWSDSPRYPRRR